MKNSRSTGPDDPRWAVNRSRATPGRRLKAPLVAGEDDVCALLAGELREVPAARRVKGEGTEGSNNHRRGRFRWAERRTERPVPVARAPDTPRKILHPSVSPLPLVLSFLLLPGCHGGAAIPFLSVARTARAVAPPTCSLGGKGEARPATSKVQAKASSLFRVRHFTSILLPAAASASSWPNSPSRQPPIHAAAREDEYR